MAGAFDLVIQISKRSGHRFISEIALVDTSFVESGSVHSLPLFSGEISTGMDPDEPGRQRLTAYFRQVGRVPRSSKLGLKLSDLPGHSERWLI